jgi:hypothetical protein
VLEGYYKSRGDKLTWRSIPAELLEIVPEEGLNSCQAKMGEFLAVVEKNNNALYKELA